MKSPGMLFPGIEQCDDFFDLVDQPLMLPPDCTSMKGKPYVTKSSPMRSPYVASLHGSGWVLKAEILNKSGAGCRDKSTAWSGRLESA
jgi:hypothetical protein